MRFTDVGIRGLKPQAARYEVWEDGRTGLGLRISPAGRKTWVFMYRFGGKARRMNLGTFPDTSLAAARVGWAAACSQLEGGIDPGAQFVAAKVSSRAAPSVADLAEEYLRLWAKPRKRSWPEDERLLNREVVPALGTKRVAEVTRRDIVALLDPIVERGSPIVANRTLALVRKMFNFAIDRAMLDVSPCHRVRAPAVETSRERVLDEAEIIMLWWHLGGKDGEGVALSRESVSARLALKLLLVTMQRRGEVIGAPKSEFDLDSKVWTIPPERAKNGLLQRVPLSNLAVSIVKQAVAESPKCPWLFATPRPKADAEDAVSLMPRTLDHVLARALKSGRICAAPFSPHDFRRTAATRCTAMGQPRDWVKLVLNHADQDVTAIYDRYAYDREKRQVLDAWAAWLEVLFARAAG